MKVKLKQCNACNELKPIWKNHEGLKYCKYCWQMHNPKKKDSKPIQKQPIKQKSKKRSVEDIVYADLRKVFLQKHPGCEANLAGCTHRATDVHHTFWGNDRQNTYLKVDTWKAVCRSCHSLIHDEMSAEQAIALGLKNNYRNGRK